MTAIVGVLNSQGIAIAADSAVTVTGNKVKKVYNRSNKIFTLSKYKPVGIAIYNSADYMGIPLETIIKMYRQHLRDNSFNTLQEYKVNFLEFLKSKLSKVSSEYKKNAYFSFCYEAYSNIIKNTIQQLRKREADLNASDAIAKAIIYDVELRSSISNYDSLVAQYNKTNYVDLSFNDYCTYYVNDIAEIFNHIQNEICIEFQDFSLIDPQKEAIKNTLYSLINIEFIFERHCGLVFIGFGEDEIFPSSHLVLVGYSVADQPRIRIFPAVEIKPGVFESNIVPYAQGDVTTTVLTGVDPNYKEEVKESVKGSFWRNFCANGWNN